MPPYELSILYLRCHWVATVYLRFAICAFNSLFEMHYAWCLSKLLRRYRFNIFQFSI